MKKLKTITVSHAPGQVGVSFFYEGDTPSDHFPLTPAIATHLRDRLNEALALVALPTAPGDGVALSDSVAVRIR